MDFDKIGLFRRHTMGSILKNMLNGLWLLENYVRRGPALQFCRPLRERLTFKHYNIHTFKFQPGKPSLPLFPTLPCGPMGPGADGGLNLNVLKTTR